MEAAREPGLIYTFYSYKGGVGRSMALANVGACMALAGHRVLLIDWDLEAPGLETFFMNQETCRLEGDPAKTPGIVDLLESKTKEQPLRWQDCLMYARFLNTSLEIISAGRRSEDYRRRVQRLDWEALYDKHQIGNFIEQLRNEWAGAYDFVLVDSRTGITDIGDVCTVLLPDALVLLFVSNRQNVDGIKAAMRRAVEARAKLPVDRSKLVALPLPGRDELYTEYDSSNTWRKIYAEEFGDLFRAWLPKDVAPIDALQKIFIPYVTRWSFGERLPVLENQRELTDPTTIGAAYQRVATLLGSRLDWYALDKRAGAEELQGARVELQRARLEKLESEQALQRVAKSSRRWIGVLGGVIAAGVAAAVAVPILQSYRIRTQVDEGMRAAAKVQDDVSRAYAKAGALPTSNADAGVPDPLSSEYAKSIQVGPDGSIRVEYGGPSSAAIAAKATLLRPLADSDGKLSWSCSSEVDQEYLPSGCAHQDGAVSQPSRSDYERCMAGVVEGLQEKEPFSKTMNIKCGPKPESRHEKFGFSAPSGHEIESAKVERSGTAAAHTKLAQSKEDAVVFVDLKCNFGDVLQATIILRGNTVRSMSDAERQKAISRAQQACTSAGSSYSGQQSFK